MFPPGASPPDSFPICSLAHMDSNAAPYFPVPRKEVIQPHLPIRLPCYDFTPVTGPAFGCSAPFGFGHRLRASPAPMV